MKLETIAEKLLPQWLYKKIFVIRHLQKLASRNNAYLVKTGYMRSLETKEPVNEAGDPIPWMNYSFIDFLSPRLNQSMNIFEYGSGYSTLFFSDKVRSVTSIEFDRDWFKKVEFELEAKDNCEVHFYPDKERYIRAVTDFEQKNFDIIVIDGRDRVECVQHVIPYLNEAGVVILDDSWKAKFDQVFDYFEGEGFRELSFTGLKSGGMIIEKTTVFYRPDNVLNI